MCESLGADRPRRARSEDRILGRLEVPPRADISRRCLGPGAREQGRRAGCVAGLGADARQRRPKLDEQAAHGRPRDRLAVREGGLKEPLGGGQVPGRASIGRARECRARRRIWLAELAGHPVSSVTDLTGGTRELPSADVLIYRMHRGRVVTRMTVRSVAVLKTFDPPTTALEGLAFDGCVRRGKFLDLALPPLHLVVHLARGGWIRLRDKPTNAGPALRGPAAGVGAPAEPMSAMRERIADFTRHLWQ